MDTEERLQILIELHKDLAADVQDVSEHLYHLDELVVALALATDFPKEKRAGITTALRKLVAGQESRIKEIRSRTEKQKIILSRIEEDAVPPRRH